MLPTGWGTDAGTGQSVETAIRERVDAGDVVRPTELAGDLGAEPDAIAGRPDVIAQERALLERLDGDASRCDALTH